jgi:hypothetical protein
VSFEVTLKKGMSTSKRTLVVELHKHVVTQLMGTSGAERKVNPCREYARMKRKGAEMEVILDDGHGHRRKKYVTFRSAQEALSFEQLLTLDNAVGDQLRATTSTSTTGSPARPRRTRRRRSPGTRRSPSASPRRRSTTSRRRAPP